MKIKKLSELDHWDSNYNELSNDKTYFKNKLFKSYSHQLFWKNCKKFLTEMDNAKIVEIGSAPGLRLLEFHEEMKYEPYGIEYSEHGCELNRKLFSAHNCNPDNVICADFFSNELHEEYKDYFDVVVSFGFIEHFNDVGKVIELHLNLLKPNGILVITIPNFKGINLTLSKFFTDEKILNMHNLDIMEIDNFKNLFEMEKLETYFCNYYGLFDFTVIYYVRNSSWKDIPYIALFGINQIFNYLFMILLRSRSPENKNSSPFLMYIGKKKP